MSKVALSGNASGTGTFTIASPNSNVDRTLNLPDQTATLITNSADVLNIGSGQFYKDASGNVGIGTSSPGALLDVSAAGTAVAKLTNRNSGATEVVLSLDAGGNGVSVRDSQIRGGNNGANQTYLSFYTSAAATPTERARIDSAGRMQIGATAAAYSAMLTLRSGSGASYSLTSSRIGIGTGAIGHFVFETDAGVNGTIFTNGSTTSYNTSSDYRLKEDVQPMTGALATVAQLKPVTYRWKSTGEADQGFIAHELAEVCPGAVTGEKDAVDAEGKPVYQGIDTSFLVATLTAAIQELKAIVDAQGAEIAALKGTA